MKILTTYYQSGDFATFRFGSTMASSNSPAGQYTNQNYSC